MIDEAKVADAFRNCITEPKCKDCPWESCERFNHKHIEIPADLALEVNNIVQRSVGAEAELEGGGHTWFFVCGECHAILKEHAKYCHECGKRVKWA